MWKTLSLHRYNIKIMKKVVRTVWISLLSGLAFLAACTGVKHASRNGRVEALYGCPDYNEEVKTNESTASELESMNARLDNIEAQINERKPSKRKRKKELKQQLDSIRTILSRREGACIYGTPEVMVRYANETSRLREEAADIERKIEELEKE